MSIIIPNEEFRCLKCNKLLAKENNNTSNLEIKCLRCGVVNNIFSHLKEQVIVTDFNEIILYVNDHVEHVTGFMAQEIIGQTPKLWGGQMSKQFYSQMKQILFEEKRSMVAQVTNKHKSGRLYEAILRVSPIFDSRGEIIMFIGIERVLNNKDKIFESRVVMPAVS